MLAETSDKWELILGLLIKPGQIRYLVSSRLMDVVTIKIVSYVGDRRALAIVRPVQ